MLISFMSGYLPPACLRFTFTDTAEGCPGCITSPSIFSVTARPATKAPVPTLLLTRVVAARRPFMKRTTNHACTRNLCCTWYAAYVPSRHYTDCEGGVANGAGPWRCTAFVTPASTRARDSRTEAPTGPVLCTPAMANDHTLSREHATTQRAGPHEGPLTASSGRPSERG